MKKDISKWNIYDILKNIGIYAPLDEILDCFEQTVEMANSIKNELNPDGSNIVTIINKYHDKFNFQKLLFLEYLYIKGIKKTSEIEDLSSRISHREEKIQILSKFYEKNLTIFLDITEDGTLNKIYDSRDYTTKVQKIEHTTQKLEGQSIIKEINEKIDLRYLLYMQMLTDIENIYIKLPQLGNYMRKNIILKTYGQGKEEEAKQIILYGGEDPNKPYSEFLVEFEKELMDKAEYINWDKFLLLSAYRAKMVLDSVNSYDGIEDEIAVCKKIMEVSRELIKDPKITIKGKIETNSGEIKNIKYSYKNLKEDLERNVVDGMYIGKSMIEQMKRELLEGKINISDIYSIKLLHLLKLTPNERAKCMQINQHNAIDLYRNNIISKNELKRYLETTEVYAGTIKELQNSQNKEKELEIEYIISLYLKGNITLEEISKLKEDIQAEITEEKLIQYYKSRKNEETKKQAEKYFSLYREIKIRQRTEEEKEEISNNIILELGDEMEEADFIELYRANLITINAVREWNGEEFINQMLIEGLLKPADSQKIITQNQNVVEEIKDKLRKSTLSDEEKISLIITTFPEEEHAALRAELFQILKISKSTKTKENKKETKITNPQTHKAKRNEYELDPCYKMQLLMLLDKDYTYELTRDGHMILKLPNENKVIIEKMFKRTKNGVENANGAATYIIDIAKYNASSVLTEEGKIDRSKLYEICDKDKKERYYHTKNWGEMLKEAFSIEHSEKHTNQEKQEIENLIEKIKRTRKLKEF